jgi:hypothetical protein
MGATHSGTSMEQSAADVQGSQLSAAQPALHCVPPPARLKQKWQLPVGQVAAVQVIGAQRPPTHVVWPTLQLFPQAPQLAASVWVSTQVPPQKVRPPPQSHAPFRQTRPANSQHCLVHLQGCPT